jgi:hypothetical protein
MAGTSPAMTNKWVDAGRNCFSAQIYRNSQADSGTSALRVMRGRPGRAADIREHCHAGQAALNFCLGKTRPWPMHSGWRRGMARNSSVTGACVSSAIMENLRSHHLKMRHFTGKDEGRRERCLRGTLRSRSSRRGPGPSSAKRSSGLRRGQTSRERQPQPMQSSNRSRSWVSRKMRSSISARHPEASRCQSSRDGARSSGSVASTARISLNDAPARCATRINAMRRSTPRRNRRWLPGLRQPAIKSLVS